MDVSAENEISLLNLPPDIMRIIITLVPFRARLISPVWSDIANEYLNSTRKLSLPIPDIILSIRNTSELEIVINLPEWHLDQFGLDTWTKLTREGMVCATSPAIRITEKGLPHITEELLFEAESCRRKLKKIFESCTLIEKLVIFHADCDTFSIICECLASVRIRKMTAYLKFTNANEKPECERIARSLRVEGALTINNSVVGR